MPIFIHSLAFHCVSCLNRTASVYSECKSIHINMGRTKIVRGDDYFGPVISNGHEFNLQPVRRYHFFTIKLIISRYFRRTVSLSCTTRLVSLLFGFSFAKN